MADERSEQQAGRGRATQSAVKAAAFIALAVLTAGGGAWLLTRWVNARAAMGRVATNPAVVAALNGYVKIKFQAEDPDAQPAKAVMQKFDAVGLPTYVILRPK